MQLSYAKFTSWIPLCQMESKRSTKNHIVHTILVPKKPHTCIMLILLIIFISSMLLSQVQIKAKSSRYSFDTVFKLTFQ